MRLRWRCTATSATTRSTGTGAPERIATYCAVPPGSSWAVGEVLDWAPGSSSADAVVAQWLASTIHRRALLGRWQGMGIAAVHQTAAPGVFGGADVTIVVVDFVRR